MTSPAESGSPYTKVVENVPGEFWLFPCKELAIAGISDKLSEINMIWCVFCIDTLGDLGLYP